MRSSSGRPRRRWEQTLPVHEEPICPDRRRGERISRVATGDVRAVPSGADNIETAKVCKGAQDGEVEFD
jgi:hypothetical protein